MVSSKEGGDVVDHPNGRRCCRRGDCRPGHDRTRHAGPFGQQVVVCAHMMLPYDLSAGGSITTAVPGGTIMYFRTFGAMVTFMQSSPMCLGLADH